MDAKTVIVSNIIILVVAAIVLGQNAFQHRKVPGVDLWAASSLCALLGIATILTREYWPHHRVINVMVVNLFLTGQFALINAGLARFAGMHVKWGLLIFLLCLQTAISFWFFQIDPDLRGRLGWFAISLQPILLLNLYYLFQLYPQKFQSVLFLPWAVFIAEVAFFIFVASMSPNVPRELAGWGDLRTLVAIVFEGFGVLLMLQTFALVMLTGHRVQQDLDKLATLDPLTNLLNRRALFEEGDQACAHAVENGQAISVLFLDVDHFKTINDRFGHGVGDQILLGFVARVQSQLRRSDRFGRLGGEEFAVVLPAAPISAATNIAERIRQSVAEAPFQIGDATVHLTVSIGVFVHDTQTPPNFDTMISNADTALYKAKDNGRNRVENFADQLMNTGLAQTA